MKFKKKNSFFKKMISIIIVFIIIYILLVVSILIISLFDNNVNEEKEITRNKAFKRAMDIVNYKWEYNNKTASENIIPPYYIGDKNEYIGIPYCYGGQISIDNSNIKGVKDFNDAIKKGYHPGNINTKYGYIKNTAGLDCSGFIAAVYNIEENISTNTMDKYFERINYKNIKSMDIINSKGRHVYIFLGLTKDEKGVLILESTSNGNKKYKDKTVVNYKTINEVKKDLEQRGYVPMRYIGLKDENVNYLFDNYEYNNKENFSKRINKEIIKGSIDYLEDVDYYSTTITGENTYLKVNKLGKNQEIHIYNKKKRMIIEKEGSYELDFKGEVFIVISLKYMIFSEKEYVFQVID